MDLHKPGNSKDISFLNVLNNLDCDKQGWMRIITHYNENRKGGTTMYFKTFVYISELKQ